MATIFEKLDQTGKTVIITGGYRGIGLGITETFAQAHARIAICGRNAEEGEKVAQKYRDQGTDCRFYTVDMQELDQVEGFADAVARDFGSIDILVNNAGVTDHISIEDTDLKSWNWVINTNMRGPFFLSRKVGMYMHEHNIEGSIVTVSSMSAFVANTPQKQATYNMTKAALCAMTQCLAFEWAPHHIRVNAVCPGYIYSGMFIEGWGQEWIDRTPLGYLGQPEDVGGMCLYLASDAAHYMTGASVVVDGGYTIL